jgi:hypothetical protein
MTTLANIEAIEWRGSWEAVANDVERQFLETELTTTLHPAHTLYKRPITAIARRTDNDEVLFLVRNSGGGGREFVQVHLTGSTERTPDEPACTLFVSLEAWMDAAFGGEG